MGEQPYRQVDRVEDVCEDYDVLIGPDGFQCFLGEPEDRCWRRDGKAVVDELNRLHAEIARLKEQREKAARELRIMHKQMHVKRGRSTIDAELDAKARAWVERATGIRINANGKVEEIGNG